MAPSHHPQALPRRERIRKRPEYLDAQAHGRRLATPHLLVFVRPPVPSEEAASDRPTRMGLTVSKKVGGAVERNRVKRRLRELFRRHKDWFPAARDIVIVARPGAAEMDSAALEGELEKLCTRHFARC